MQALSNRLTRVDAATPSLWSAGVLSTLRVTTEPSAWMAARSVNVPPTSMPAARPDVVALVTRSSGGSG